MEHWQFVTMKSHYGPKGFSPYLTWRNRYTVSRDEPIDWPDLYEISTRLMTAERCLINQDLDFKHVVAIKASESHPYDLETPAFVMSRPLYDTNTAWLQAQGYRLDQPISEFSGVSVVHNRHSGRTIQHWYANSYCNTDVPLYMPEWKKKPMSLLRTDTDLADFWFPLYADILRQVEGLDVAVSIDHLGNVQEVSPLVNDRILAHATQMERQRRQWLRFGGNFGQIEGWIQGGMDLIASAQQKVALDNLFFTSQWGAGDYLHSIGWADTVHTGIGHWAGLAYALDMTIPDPINHYPREIAVTTDGAYLPLDPKVALPEDCAIVYDLVARLWAIELEFITIKLSLQNVELRQRWQNGRPAGSDIDAMYANWNKGQDLVHEAMRCFALIQSVMTFKPKQGRGPDYLPRRIPQLDPTFSATPGVEDITNCYVTDYIPLPYVDRGPYLGTPDPDTVVVRPNKHPREQPRFIQEHHRETDPESGGTVGAFNRSNSGTSLPSGLLGAFNAAAAWLPDVSGLESRPHAPAVLN